MTRPTRHISRDDRDAWRVPEPRRIPEHQKQCRVREERRLGRAQQPRRYTPATPGRAQIESLLLSATPPGSPEQRKKEHRAAQVSAQVAWSGTLAIKTRAVAIDASRTEPPRSRRTKNHTSPAIMTPHTPGSNSKA